MKVSIPTASTATADEGVKSAASVDDVKKTVAKARKLGANVQVDYMAIGDMGAIGVFVDPTGAPIGVWETAKKKAKKTAKKGTTSS
jgi:predicted enzyme related to lactoylglutathione lyase